MDEKLQQIADLSNRALNELETTLLTLDDALDELEKYKRRYYIACSILDDQLPLISDYCWLDEIDSADELIGKQQQS